MTAFVARNIDPAAANAIHDDDVAQQFGFAGALVPGVELWGRTASALVAQHGPGFLAGGRLDLRFRRPVYDGETMRVDVADDGGVVLRGPDDEARAVGSTSFGPVPDVQALAVAPLPDRLPPPEPASLPTGPLGTVREPVTRARVEEYVAQVGDPLPLYVREGVLHPGLLLRAVNLVLMQNVALGPWIHTRSDAVLLAAAPADAVLQVRAAVRGTSVRGGHDEIRYDALVLADDVPVLQVDHTALYRLRPGTAPE